MKGLHERIEKKFEKAISTRQDDKISYAIVSYLRDDVLGLLDGYVVVPRKKLEKMIWKIETDLEVKGWNKAITELLGDSKKVLAEEGDTPK